MSCASSSNCYNQRKPGGFDEVVAPDYLGLRPHAARARPQRSRDDYQNAVKVAGTVIGYTIDALVADGEMVAAVWTGTLPAALRSAKD